MNDILDTTVALLYCLIGGIFLQGEVEALIGLLFKLEGFADGPLKVFLNSCIGLAILTTMVMRAIKAYKEIYPPKKNENTNGISDSNRGTDEARKDES